MNLGLRVVVKARETEARGWGGGMVEVGGESETQSDEKETVRAIQRLRESLDP